jgi:hypothetical protein
MYHLCPLVRLVVAFEFLSRNESLREFCIIRGCIQMLPDWLPGARTANGKALCQYVQFYRYFVS